MDIEECTEYGNEVCCVTSNEADALDMAIKALEQEPCEDAVSRKAVLDLPRIKSHNHWGNVIAESVNVEDIQALPPVTPTRIETVTDFADRCMECGKNLDTK